MFRHLTQSQLNRLQWDTCITQAPNGYLYALSWSLDIIAPGWEALVKEEAGQYVAVLPLPVRRKLGLRYLLQPPFAQQLGLFSLAAPTPADWQQIGLLLRQRFQYIPRYAFNPTNIDLLPSQPLGEGSSVQHAYYLSLQPAYAQLLAGYHSSRVRRLAQARRYQLVVEPTTNVDLLVQLYAENVAPKIAGFIGEAYEFRLLRALYAAARERGLAELWQARAATGEVVAMAMFFRFKTQLTYAFSAATPAGKKASAAVLLLDKVFQAYAGQDLYFNFGTEGVASVVDFYRSFGALPVPFPVLALNQLPWPLRQLRVARAALYGRLRRRPQ